MSKIIDSGDRTEFSTGAVRDLRVGKGRCDLMPLEVIGFYLDDDVLVNVNNFLIGGSTGDLWDAIEHFNNFRGWDMATALLEVSHHYEDGCEKYGERNWEKGIPVHCYIDSAVRHYFKYLRGDTDEPHDRAFVWNILGALWTAWNKPKLIDIPGKNNMFVAELNNNNNVKEGENDGQM